MSTPEDTRQERPEAVVPPPPGAPPVVDPVQPPGAGAPPPADPAEPAAPPEFPPPPTASAEPSRMEAAEDMTQRPEALLGAAFAGGFLAALILKRLGN